MKKVFNSLFVIVASMVTFAGCAKQEIDAPSVETKTVQFIAESIETKTVFGTPNGTTYPTLWTENDQQIKILLNLNEEAEAEVTVSDDFKTATFNAGIEVKAENGSSAPFTFYAMSPASAYLGKNSERYSATIPTDQTPLENSVDEAAQILYAVSDSYAEFPSTVPLVFKHFTAYGKLTFDNLDLAGATITNISITSSVNFAGRWNYFVADGSFGENSGSSTITLNTTATENVWFACAPVDMSGKTLKFTINTDKGPISKEVTLPSGRKFEAGKIASMIVDMSDATLSESKVYELVTDIAQITEGAKVIIAAAEQGYAISKTQNNNNRAQAAQAKKDNTIVDPADDVEIFVVEAGASAGTYALNATKYSGYIYAAGGTGNNNHLKTKSEKDLVSSWNISISNTDGVATIKCADSQVARNTLRYNSSSSIFSCYASGQNDVAIYKLQGDVVPDTTPSIVVADAELEIGSEGGDLEFEYTLKNLNASLTAEVVEGNEMVEDLSVGDGCVSVTVAENTLSQARLARIQLSCGDADPVILTVRQKAHIVNAVIEDGKYWIVASEKVAKPLSGNYGWIYVDDVWTSATNYSSVESNAFTFTAVDGGYTIQDAAGKYYYMKDTYNNFNVDASTQSDNSHIWDITIDEDGAYIITNTVKDKYIQYSVPNKSFGSYSDAQGVLPILVKAVNPVVDISVESQLNFTAEAASQKITLPSGVSVVPSVDNSAFAVSVSANVVTVSVSDATVAQTGSLTLVITYNGYSVTKTVTLNQAAPITDNQTVIVLSAATKPCDTFPEGSTGSKVETSYTIGDYEWTFSPSSGNKFSWYDNGDYILWGKSGGYILMPAVPGKKLTSVTILTGTGASTSVKVGVYNAGGTAAVSGGEVKTLSQQNAEFTWTLTGTEVNTHYQLRVTSNHNAQLQTLTLIYE